MAGLKLFEQNLEAAVEDDDLQTARLAHYNSSETLRRLGQDERAEAEAREALRIAEDVDDRDALHETRIQLALSLMDLDRLDDAAALLREVAEGDSSQPNRAAALSSLGSIALGQQQPEAAASLYRQALAAGERNPKGTAETLLGLCEALATTGSRRPYVRTLQRVVDALALVPYDTGLAARFLRCAMRWHDNGSEKYAVEALAVAVLVGAAQFENDDPSPLTENPLLVGLGVVGGAMGSHGPFPNDLRFRKLVEEELAASVPKRTARSLMRFVQEHFQ